METAPAVLRFESFELDTRSRELRRGAKRIRLQEQPFEILRLMLERPGDVVTREQLRQRLWPAGTAIAAPVPSDGEGPPPRDAMNR